jgi:iron complex transport system substrate-binding protein
MTRARVASLLPAATEIVCALGARAQLVGVSHECNWPADVVGLPVLTRSKVPTAGRSADIDRAVRAVLADALSVYEVDEAALAALRPDVVVTQDLCDVCAVSLDDVRDALRRIAGEEIDLVSLSPARLDDLFADVRAVARALGLEARGEALGDELRGRMQAVRARSAALATRPKVLTIEWLDPVMVGGTWMPELVELAGGEPLVTAPGDHAPTLDRAALASLAPEVVLVKPCGFDLARSRGELDTLAAQLAGLPWPALEREAVWLADGNAFFNRPGPRLVESLEILAACVHPAAFADLAARHAAHFERVGS